MSSKNPQIYVGGLPYDIRESELRREFDRYGAIVNLSIKPKFAFIVSIPLFDTLGRNSKTTLPREMQSMTCTDSMFSVESLLSNKPKILGVALVIVMAAAAVVAVTVRKAVAEIVSAAAHRTAIVVSFAVDKAIGHVNALKTEVAIVVVVAVAALHVTISEVVAETVRVVVTVMTSTTVNGVKAAASAAVRKATRTVADSNAQCATKAVAVAEAAAPPAGVVVASVAAGDATVARPQWTTDAKKSSVITTDTRRIAPAVDRPKTGSTMKNRKSPFLPMPTRRTTSCSN